MTPNEVAEMYAARIFDDAVKRAIKDLEESADRKSLMFLIEYGEAVNVGIHFGVSGAITTMVDEGILPS